MEIGCKLFQNKSGSRMLSDFQREGKMILWNLLTFYVKSFVFWVELIIALCKIALAKEKFFGDWNLIPDVRRPA